ncbi:MAG TPA: hypothetical protein VGE20_00425, partial [Ramlibacter sp.]
QGNDDVIEEADDAAGDQASRCTARSGAQDSVKTVYGCVSREALIAAQSGYDIRALLRCVEEFRQALEYLGSEQGLVDRVTRLYCMSATVLYGSCVVVPPDDGGLQEELRELRSDLHDAIDLFQGCERLLKPLEQLLVMPADGPAQARSLPA